MKLFMVNTIKFEIKNEKNENKKHYDVVFPMVVETELTQTTFCTPKYTTTKRITKCTELPFCSEKTQNEISKTFFKVCPWALCGQI